ncbi:7352_t:CDS:2 [Diversispora eburnea]|uniref:7352_t:CDS:1 n=1 Tax=Diversispora eburnea TaxID=1213867 RepID=A0A9N8UWW9_9GLOM|nr:7352_t:CDS:2 [Diversispora eburnea]
MSFTIGLELTTKVKFNVQIVCQNYYYSKSEQSPHFLINFNNEMCDIPEIQSITSELMSILNLCSAVPGIFVLGLFGSISDKKGRRIILLLAALGFGINSLTVIFVGNFWEYIGSNYSKYLMLGCLLDGFSGGLLSLFATIHAYAADCSTPKQRSIIFGWIQGVLFMGIALGSVTSGLILESTDNIISVFYLSVILSTIFFLFVLFILPESVSFDKRLENHPQQSQPPARKKTNWKQFMITYFMLVSAAFGVQNVMFLYTSYVFKWSLIEQDEKEKRNGLLYDVWVIRFGLIIDSFAFLIYGLATNSIIFVTGGIFGAFGIIANSTIRSVQTNLVPSSQVGQLLGAISVVETIARITAPAIFNSMYSYLVVTTAPNVVWYTISGMLFFGVILMFLIVPKK